MVGEGGGWWVGGYRGLRVGVRVGVEEDVGWRMVGEGWGWRRWGGGGG